MPGTRGRNAARKTPLPRAAKLSGSGDAASKAHCRGLCATPSSLRSAAGAPGSAPRSLAGGGTRPFDDDIADGDVGAQQDRSDLQRFLAQSAVGGNADDQFDVVADLRAPRG